MTNSTPDKGATALVFQAPPSLPDTDPDPGWDPDQDSGWDPDRDHDLGGAGQRADSRRDDRPSGPSGNGARHAGGPLRMLRGARAAAAGMKISDDQIRAVLEDPQDVQPDPNQPTRTRLQRDGVTVTTGNDGMILRVTRKR
jgi:hypothetical protein